MVRLVASAVGWAGWVLFGSGGASPWGGKGCNKGQEQHNPQHETTLLEPTLRQGPGLDSRLGPRDLEGLLLLLVREAQGGGGGVAGEVGRLGLPTLTMP
jgi:hypothetical protein